MKMKFPDIVKMFREVRGLTPIKQANSKEPHLTTTIGKSYTPTNFLNMCEKGN